MGIDQVLIIKCIVIALVHDDFQSLVHFLENVKEYTFLKTYFPGLKKPKHRITKRCFGFLKFTWVSTD